jgi:hypothetical protein
LVAAGDLISLQLQTEILSQELMVTAAAVLGLPAESSTLELMAAVPHLLVETLELQELLILVAAAVLHKTVEADTLADLELQLLSIGVPYNGSFCKS